ncbi:MAG TPA: hypothetical protein VMH81_17960 [Bryobacteraceae bacterium]|nr:hypothetical protein [Bryobacteraceae bacterium]
MGEWSKVDDLFHAALAQPPEKRADFLQQACPDNQLRHAVQVLLENARTDTYLKGSPLSTIEASPPVLSPGQMVGAFEVVELIGRGAWVKSTKPGTRVWAAPWPSSARASTWARAPRGKPGPSPRLIIRISARFTT